MLIEKAGLVFCDNRAQASNYELLDKHLKIDTANYMYV